MGQARWQGLTVHEQQPLEEDRPQVNLNPLAGELVQGAVCDEPLIQHRHGNLNDIRVVAPRQRGRVILGVGREADLLEEALAFQALQSRPQSWTVGTVQILTGLDQQTFGARDAQPFQRTPGAMFQPV